MSDKLAIIEAEAAAELEHLKTAIVDYDREVRSAFQRQMGYAFLAGCALLRAKEIIPHGKFLEWRETELPEVSRSSASRYTQFAEALVKDPTVGSLKEVRLLNRGDELTTEQQEKVARVVHKLADGKTLTEMYRDLGVIRQPEKPKHHPRKQAAVSAEEELEAKKLSDLDLMRACTGPVTIWCDVMENADDHERPHYKRKDLEEMLNVCTRATGILRELLKGGAR